MFHNVTRLVNAQPQTIGILIINVNSVSLNCLESSSAKNFDVSKACLLLFQNGLVSR